jgi:hypothetical protein
MDATDQMSGTLRRIVPATAGQRVSVTAFNSSIRAAVIKLLIARDLVLTLLEGFHLR